MADEETQVREESLWWAFDASSGQDLPDTTFDEPLEWPDALPWDDAEAGGAPPADLFASLSAGDPNDMGVALLFPPEPDPPAEASPGPEVEDGGPATELHLESLPESIWAGDEEPAAAEAGAATVAAPTFYAEAEGTKSGTKSGRWPRLAFPRGNAVVVALICFVSLVLLGMFLSVRARTDVPTRTTPSTAPSDDIAATRPLNTIPLAPGTTAVTTPGIALSDLVPPPDAGADAGAATGPARNAPRSATPATTARSGAPAATGTTAPQATATTAAPESPATTTPSVTSPSTDDTTQTTNTTRPRSATTRPSISIPDWPSMSITRPTTGRDS